MRLSPAAALVALLCACQPNPKAPVTVMALLYSSNGKLAPKQTTLQTVGSVANLKGSVAELVGGASIVIDPMDPAQQNLFSLSANQLEDALYRDRGGDVRANLIDKSGVLWPADFHSWNIVSLYWNFEQAFLYFQRIYDGASADGLLGARVLYWGNYKNLFIGDPERQDLTDNFIYYSPVQAFLLAPFKDLQKVPLALNPGIIGHEYAHRVFNQKAFGDQPLPAPLQWQGAPLNLLKSLDEGLADFHGYGVTCSAKDSAGCSTQFLLPSFDEAIARKRDFSRSTDNCMSVELRTAINSLPPDQFLSQGKQYDLGTLFAASLYQAANKGGKVEMMQKLLITAYDDETTLKPGFKQVFNANVATPEKITLEKLADVILSHVTDPDLKRLTCNELWDRLDLQPSQIPIPSCPNTSIRGTSCPVLPPP